MDGQRLLLTVGWMLAGIALVVGPRCVASDVLVRYPDYPAAIERDDAYAVCVRQGDETRRLVVWNHCEKSILDGRTRGGDVNRRFCEFAFAGSPVTVDIAVREDVKCYKVFPARKGLKHAFRNGVISVTLTEPTYFGVQLNDYDKTILSVFADAPEKAEDVPALGAADVLRIEGWLDAQGADGVLEVPKDVREVYLAPGAVLNARLRITHPHVRLHGRGMILDPMSDIFRYDQIRNPSRGFVVVKATDVNVEGVKLVDARTFNFMAWNYGAQPVTFRNVKVLSSMMCTDGFTVGGKNLLVDNAWLYVGDNALVVSGIRDATFRNVAIGTSCKAIYPQCSNLRVRMANVDVFRADEGLIANEYNGVLRRNNKWDEMGTGLQKREPGPQDLEHQTESFFFDGLSAVDATYTAYVFRCKNMGDLPKTFTFSNLSVPHVSGRDSWRLAGQTNGVSVAVLNDPAKWLNTSNCRFAVTNLYLAGQRAAAFPSFAVEPKDAAILDLSVVTDERLPRTVPLGPDHVEVNWTCPDKRKTRRAVPLANLLEDRPATRSIWQRCPSWNVKLDACLRDEAGAVVYRLRQCEKWAGMQAVLTERVKAAGFGKYRLTFETKATSETPFTLRVSAITNEKRNLVHLEGDRSGAWKAYTTEIDLAFDPALTDLVALMLSVSAPVDELCFRNFRLTKVQKGKPLRVLAIGNSYTQSLHPEFAKVARAAGCDLDLTIFAIGGNSLSNHFVNAVAALADPALRPYWVNGRKANLLDVLAEKAYDVVVLQEQSAEGMDPKWFDPWADRLIAFVRDRQPQAKFWLQQTWSDPVASYRITDKGVKGALGLTQDEMFAALEKNYAVQAKRLGARIVPVGAALQIYRKGLPVRLVKPTKAELAALKDGEVPDLKGELAGWWYWGKGKTWESDYGVYRLRQDFQHLNPEGRYLQACVWTAALFGVDLAKLDYAPDLGADFARRAPFIRACVMKAVSASAVAHGTNLWHYAQMDFELYRLEAMRDEARRAGMSVDHPGRLPEWRKPFAFRIRCDAAARPPFRTAHVASSDWKDGYLTVTTDGGWRDVGALCSPVRGWEAQTFDGVWRPAATYLGGETPPHRDDLPEDRTFAGLVATNGCYDAGAEVLAYVECAAAAEPKLFVGESLPELAEESLSRMEQLPRLRRVADGRWRTETALAFRYLRFRGGAVSDVKVVPVGWPLTERGTFASSNPRHGRLREVGARTLRLCALDFLVDGIKRDRLPWGGDLAVSLLADAYVFGDAEIVRRSLSVLDAYAGDVNGIVTYSMWLVVCHDLYQLYFGDRAFLDERWWRVKARVEDLVSRTDGRGFVVKDIKWAFVDWTGPESRTAVQAIWAGALDAAARLADRVKDVRAVDYRALAAKVRKSLNAAAWDEARGLYRVNPDATSAFSRQPNVYAVVFGVADAAKARRIGAELAKDELPPVGTPYVRGWELVALNRAGFHTAFLDGLERTFGAMLDAGATTYWEGLDVAETGDARYAFYGRPWGKSLCHAWSAWPAFLFVSEAMGVKPTADGWATCEAKPIPGAEGMRATVPTPHGVRAFGPESAAAFVMRFDDNKPVAHWREVAEIFEAVGGRCSFAVNAASLSEEQWAALRDLSARGHEIMDHTAQHAVFLLPAATDAEAAAHRAAAFFDHAEQGGRLVFCRPEIDLADSGNVRVRAAMTNGVLRSSDPAFLRLQGVGRKFHVPSVGKTYGFGTSCGYGLFKKGPEQRCSDFWGRWTNDSFGPREIVILADAAVQPSLDLLRAQARASVSRFVAHGLPSPKTWIRPGGWEGGVDGRRMKAVYGDEFGYAVADSTLAQGLPKGSPWCRRSDFEFFDRVPDVDKVYRRMADVLARGQSFAYISHQWTKDRAQFLEQCRAFAARLKAGGIRLTTYSHIAEGQTRVMQSKRDSPGDPLAIARKR